MRCARAVSLPLLTVFVLCAGCRPQTAGRLPGDDGGGGSGGGGGACAAEVDPGEMPDECGNGGCIWAVENCACCPADCCGTDAAPSFDNCTALVDPGETADGCGNGVCVAAVEDCSCCPMDCCGTDAAPGDGGGTDAAECLPDGVACSPTGLPPCCNGVCCTGPTGSDPGTCQLACPVG